VTVLLWGWWVEDIMNLLCCRCSTAVSIKFDLYAIMGG